MIEAGKIQKSGSLGWSCPSNIAIVKYWGKKAVQLPMNPSLSMTLSEAKTLCRVSYDFDPARKETEIIFSFEGREAPAFEERISRTIASFLPWLPGLAHCRLEIDSENTFPHSSGIASSASAMGALALCMTGVALETGPGEAVRDFPFREASRLARLGSGSASRSLWPGFAVWGKTSAWEESSDEYAIAVPPADKSFSDVRDSILIVSAGQKEVSSSTGHRLMESHPYAAVRFDHARTQLLRLKEILESGDWPAMIAILEAEALALHAMMMTADPPFLLMQPNTLAIIRRVREFRADSGLQLGFTLDAGANVHLLYPGFQDREIRSFIENELGPYCEAGRMIHDRSGSGPQKLQADA